MILRASCWCSVKGRARGVGNSAFACCDPLAAEFGLGSGEHGGLDLAAHVGSDGGVGRGEHECAVGMGVDGEAELVCELGGFKG